MKHRGPKHTDHTAFCSSKASVLKPTSPKDFSCSVSPPASLQGSQGRRPTAGQGTMLWSSPTPLDGGFPTQGRQLCPCCPTAPRYAQPRRASSTPNHPQATPREGARRRRYRDARELGPCGLAFPSPSRRQALSFLTLGPKKKTRKAESWCLSRRIIIPAGGDLSVTAPTSAEPGVSPARERPARLHALPSPPASRGKPSFVPLPAIGTGGGGKARAGRGQGCVAAGRMFGRALSIPCSTGTPGRGHGAGVLALNTTTQSCSAGSPRNTTELRTVLPILGAQRVGGGEYGIAVFAWWYF